MLGLYFNLSFSTAGLVVALSSDSLDYLDHLDVDCLDSIDHLVHLDSRYKLEQADPGYQLDRVSFLDTDIDVATRLIYST